MFQAEYFDGLSAKAKSVWVEVGDKGININVEGKHQFYQLTALEVQAKLGATKRIIDLPDGARLEAVNISEIEAAIPSKSAYFWSTLHYLENHLAWVLVSLFLTVFAGWAFLQHGVPKLAETVAKATPASMELSLGEQVLKGLDNRLSYFSPSKIEKGQQTEIINALSKFCEVNDCPAYKLEFRDGGIIGANAFALPGGIMVVTDGLVELAKHHTEIVAVLAHELGHVQHRHAFRQSIQSTLSGLLFAALTGDVSSMASGLPAALMQMRYSRLHELEADRFALKALQNACIPPQIFADILLRLHDQTSDFKEKKANRKSVETSQSQSSDPVSHMLSTHPNTIERIKPFLSAKPAC